jgi:hypothetical protein
MKYFFFSFLLISFAFNCNAQEVFGIRGGVGVSSLQFEKGYQATPKPGIGVNFGVDYLLKINAPLDFESGLFFRQKGQRIKKTGTVMSLNATFMNKDEMLTYRLNYLYLPLCLNYKFNSSLFVSGGIYMAYGLKGLYLRRSTYTDSKTNEVVRKENYKTELLRKVPRDGFTGSEVFRKFDCGLILGAGYRFSRFCVRADFDLGLLTSVKINDPFFPFDLDENNKKFKNRSLSLSMVYYLSDKYYDIRF